MQATQLHRNQEQEENHRETLVAQVLSGLPDAHRAQGGEGLNPDGMNGALAPASGRNSRVSSSNWQSTGLQIRGLQVRSLPGPSSFHEMLNMIADEEAQ